MNDIEIAVEILGESDQALRVYDGRIADWVPKSLILDTCEQRGQITSIFIPEWLAEEKGFI